MTAAALALPNPQPFGLDNMFGYLLAQQLPWLARHHYLQDLEACPPAAIDVVQAAHARLFTTLADVTADALGRRDHPLAEEPLIATRPELAS